MTTRKKLTALVGGLAILAASLGFFATPYFALERLESAVDNEDMAALREKIDFQSIRQGLKDDLAAKLAVPPGSSDQVSEAAREFAVELLDGVIDAMVTPENLIKLVKTGQLGPADNEGLLTLSPNMRLHTGYTGFNTFKVTVADKYNQNASLYFTMTRDGFASWKVSAVHVPF